MSPTKRNNQEEREKQLNNLRNFIRRTRLKLEVIENHVEGKIREKNIYKKDNLPPSFGSYNCIQMCSFDVESALGVPYPGDVNSHQDLIVKYTSEQRRQLYEYVIANVPTPEHLKLKALHESIDYEKLFNSSDCKRRRFASYTAELRYIIQIQMQSLGKTMQDSTCVKPDGYLAITSGNENKKQQ